MKRDNVEDKTGGTHGGPSPIQAKENVIRKPTGFPPRKRLGYGWVARGGIL